MITRATRFEVAAAVFCAAAIASTPSAFADEGMWTYDNFPADKVREQYGTAPDAAWLEHLRLSSVKLGRGCSGSFVSSTGLILTNHHCVSRCIEQLSTPKNNLIERGFLAKRARRERKCPGLSVARLEAIVDVTAKVKAATDSLEGDAFKKAERAIRAELEAACAKDDRTRCDVVRLYNGGQFHLYRYTRFNDVRLAFAPEIDVAAFGGDPDNFEFPRYCLDMALVRAYEKGKPVAVEHFLKVAERGPEAGNVVYVSGHPGRTQRLKTVAQLAHLRDISLPSRLMGLAERKGVLSEFIAQSPQNERIAQVALLRTQNAYKAYRRRRASLVNEDFFAQLVKEEINLRQALLERDQGSAAALAWNEIAGATKAAGKRRIEAEVKEHHRGYGSTLVSLAWTLVRSAQERAKPNAERLPEFGQARLPGVEANLFADRPIYPKLEIAMLRWGLTRARELLGPDDPFIIKLLAGRSPEGQAAYLVKKTGLRRASLRKKLYKGGLDAVKASRDPLIRLVLDIEADGRAVRAWYESDIEPIIKNNESRIADARFSIYGTKVYPDATGTLRLSYGAVDGFPDRGRTVTPFTLLKGLKARNTGVPPFSLPRKWRKALDKLPSELRVNLTTTNDIIGGNSGSPLVNADGKLIGLVFDGNRYSLGGAYGFDAKQNRTVAVHADFMRAALKEVYGATGLVEELGWGEAKP